MPVVFRVILWSEKWSHLANDHKDDVMMIAVSLESLTNSSPRVGSATTDMFFIANGKSAK